MAFKGAWVGSSNTSIFLHTYATDSSGHISVGTDYASSVVPDLVRITPSSSADYEFHAVINQESGGTYAANYLFDVHEAPVTAGIFNSPANPATNPFHIWTQIFWSETFKAVSFDLEFFTAGGTPLTYVAGDVVTYVGHAYLAVAESTDEAPGSGASWLPLWGA